MGERNSSTDIRLQAFLDGDDEALVTLCERYDQPLRKVVRAYLDPNVQRRVDESDVIQLTWIDAVKQLRKSGKPPHKGLFALIRSIAKERVIDAHRAHREAEARNVYQEQALDIPDASINNLVDRLADLHTSPSQALHRSERKRLVEQALTALKPDYREIIVLRFIEELSTEECAEVLGLTKDATKSRQRRALLEFSREIGKDLTS